MTIVQQRQLPVKTPSLSPTPPITPQESQAKEQAKDKLKKRARVIAHSSFYRYLLAETRRRAPYKVNDIARVIVGMDCDEAYRLVHSIKKPIKKRGIRECKRCGRETRDHIEGYCFDCYMRR